MRPKRLEDAQLQQYLNKLLDELPLIEPPSSLTDKVMSSLSLTSSIQNSSKAVSKSMRWRREIVHGLIATAATFLFINTGILQRIMTLDDQVVQLSAYIEKLSQLIR